MKRAEVHTFSHAMALAIPWSVLLALSFLLAAAKDARRRPRALHSWEIVFAILFVVVVFVEPFTNIISSILFWREKTGQHMSSTEGMCVMFIGLLGIWIIGRGNREGVLQKMPLFVAGLFLTQQVAASMVHTLHWWRSDMLGMIALGVDEAISGRKRTIVPAI